MDDAKDGLEVGLKRRESCWSLGGSDFVVELAIDHRRRSLRSGMVTDRRGL